MVKKTLLLVLFAVPLSAQEMLGLKEPPKRPSFEADVQIEQLEFLDDCPPEKICVEGHLYNAGAKTAHDVRLSVEIAGTKHSNPRVVLPFKVEHSVMNPGDRQDFSLLLDRKVTYRAKKKDRIVEVGRYNFKIIPKWANMPKKSLKRRAK